jgi:hypothetical protein
MPKSLGSDNSALAIGDLPPEINCFFVGVGGPEPEMRKNTCFRNINGTTQTYKIGTWAGGIPRNSEVSLDVPSGKDRVIYLAGFNATAAVCRDFKKNGYPPDQTTFYSLGKAGGVNLEPGKVVSVPLVVNYDENDKIDKCDGPDFPDDNGPQGPYLRIEGLGSNVSGTNLELATKDVCYPVTFRIYDTNGSPMYNLETSDIVISNFPSEFYISSSCSGQLTSANIPQNSNSSATAYFKKTSAGPFLTGNLNLNISRNAVPLSINVDQNIEFGNPKVSISGANINDGTCTSYTANLKKHEGDSLSLPTNVSLNLIQDSTLYSLRSTSGCIGTGADQINIPIGESSANFYFKFIGTPPQTINFINLIPGLLGIDTLPFIVNTPL